MITIIVLLILAGVTIATLTGDNGLLQKATSAKEQTKSAEAEEQIKLIYAEYQISKYAEGNTSAGDYLKEQLEKTYGEGNVDIISQEESIILKVIENGESKFYEYNPSTGISKELQKGINYNGKTASEIRPGNDITIVTEKFKVFSIDNGVIKAMPYYNITLTDKPVQSKNAGTIRFASQPYWEAETDNIDMTYKINNSDAYANNIQRFIESYKNTLENMEAGNIDIRVARTSDVQSSGITNEMKNPGKIGYYWLGSSSDNKIFVCMIYNTGVWGGNSAYYGNFGVRPIIEIPIE